MGSTEKNTTILVGTCRVKRPRIYFKPDIRSRATLLRSHVHYPREILQMLQYLHGDIEIPNTAIPFIVDDVNNGNITSWEEVKLRREESLKALQAASRIVLEVSSLKYIYLGETESGMPMYANITSVANIKKGRCKANFINIEKTLSAYPNITTAIYDEAGFTSDMQKIFGYLKGKKITLVAHFQATIPTTGKIIDERIRLGNWMKKIARDNYCEFLDQTQIVKKLGESVALKDTSHYSEAGEELMAEFLSKIISDSTNNYLVFA